MKKESPQGSFFIISLRYRLFGLSQLLVFKVIRQPPSVPLSRSSLVRMLQFHLARHSRTMCIMLY